jgi:sulfide:quinone oxidoreductase
MQTKALNKDVSVTGQLQISDLTELAEVGFKSVICNRPDGEGHDQPMFSDIRSAASKLGLESRYIPVSQGKVTDDEAALFAGALADFPSPVLACLRSITTFGHWVTR